MAIEIVDFPIENGDFPVRYVKLPEGTPHFSFPNRLVISHKHAQTTEKNTRGWPRKDESLVVHIIRWIILATRSFF